MTEPRHFLTGLRRSDSAAAAVCGAATAICFAGCDGSRLEATIGPPSPNAPAAPAPPPPVQTGVFKDGNVGGLSFISGQQQGVTDADGRYRCETGTVVAFSIGSVALGSTECTTLVMPPSLVASGALDDPQTVNIARFLLMLDRDGDPSTGITISDAVQQIAGGWPPIDFATSNLDAALVTIVADAASADGTAHALPTESVARQHLEQNLTCAYMGAFLGPFAGDLRGAMAMVVGLEPFGSAARPSAFDWLAVDANAGVELSGSGLDAVTYSWRPTILEPAGTFEPAIDARYLTPDRISGSWELPNAHERGSFELERLGDDSGEYRLVGRWGAFRQAGVLTLNLDGNRVTGEVFEVFRGRRGQIAGTLSGDTMELTVTGQMLATPTGTVSFDPSGTPLSVSGEWSRTGTFTAAACRLN